MVSRKTNLQKYEFFAAKEGGSMFSDRCRASDYQNSWPKNYHELSYAWSNEKNYHRLSWRIWASSNWMIVDDTQW